MAERQRAEAAVAASEKRFRALIENNNDVIAMFDGQGTILYTSASITRIFGYLPNDVIGTRLREYIHPDYQISFGSRWAELLEAPLQVIKMDFQVRHADGSWRWAEATAQNLLREPMVEGIVINFRDATKRRQAEQALTQTNDLLSRAEELGRIGSWSWDIVRDEVTWSDGLYRIFGLTPQEFGTPYAAYLERVHPEDREFVRLLTETAYRERGSFEFENRIARTDGEIRSLYSRGEAVLNDQGEAVGLLGVAVDITERKRAEEALWESEQKFSILFEKAAFAAALSSLPDGVILDVNEAFERTFGFTKEEVLGKTSLELGINPNASDRERVLAQLRAHGSVRKQEMNLQIKSGELRTMSVDVNIVDIGGEQYLLNMTQDITERKQAEEALRESEERFRRAIHDAPYPVQIHAEDGKVIAVNQAWVDQTGYDPAEIATIEAWTDRAYREKADEIRRQISELYAIQGRVDEGEEAIQIASGELRIWKFSSAPLGRLPDGRRFVISMAVDITERKKAEEALVISEKRFRALVENAPDGIALLDINGRLRQVTPSTEHILGYTLEEAVAQDPALLTHPHDLSDLLVLLNDLIQNPGKIGSIQYRFRHKDGSWRWLESTISNLIAEPGVEAIVFNYRDITERKQAEEQIRRQVRRLQALRLIDIAIGSSFDLHVVLEVVLQQLLTQLGVDAGAVLLFDPPLQTFEYAASRGFHSDALHHTRLKLGQGYASQAVLERKTIHIPDILETGSELAGALQLANEKFVDYYAAPLFIKGEVKGVLEVYHRSYLQANAEWLEFLETLAGQAAIAIDNAQLLVNLQRSNANLEQRVVERTAELNRTNLELEHANRAKDEFLATMSHELRTPLTSILGLSESLLEQRRGSLNEHQQNSIQIIESSGSHLLELINDILDLSKIQAGKLEFFPQPISVEEICKASLAFVKAQAVKKSIDVSYENEASISRIYADPRRLKQILVNLLINAVKFTPENGQVSLQVHTDLEQELVQFSVIDTGIGIAPEDLQKLFQPFVQVQSSLNRQYEGTGLGLALIQKLTDLHGGSVQVESEVGKGSRFTINLAYKQDEISKLETPQTSAGLPIGKQSSKAKVASERVVARGLILLAEDSMANILTIGDYLESHGYEVIIAHDGLEAIQKADAINPDIILMDIQMPVINGLDAIARLRGNPRFTSTPIIALTALAMPGDRERCLLAGASEYMSKPVSLKSLMNTIIELLGQRNE
jgi:PAS domain S-box-containing protein